VDCGCYLADNAKPRYIPYHPDVATSLTTCRDSVPNDKCKMTMMGNKPASNGEHTRDEVLRLKEGTTKTNVGWG